MAITYEPIEIGVGELLGQAGLLRGQGWRICQILSVSMGDQYELLYTFAKGLETKNLKLIVDENTVVPSITPIYAAAFLYENEIVELFGVNIENIQVSYERKLYKLDVETPFKAKK